MSDPIPTETPLTEVQILAKSIRDEVGKVIIGQADTVDLLLTALLSRGHILLEGCLLYTSDAADE